MCNRRVNVELAFWSWRRGSRCVTPSESVHRPSPRGRDRSGLSPDLAGGRDRGVLTPESSTLPGRKGYRGSGLGQATCSAAAGRRLEKAACRGRKHCGCEAWTQVLGTPSLKLQTRQESYAQAACTCDSRCRMMDPEGMGTGCLRPEGIKGRLPRGGHCQQAGEVRGPEAWCRLITLTGS